VGTTVPSASQLVGRLAAVREAFAGTVTGWPSPDDHDVNSSARPLVSGVPVAASRHPEWTHRALNVLVAAGGLLILAPVCAFIAIVIKLTSPGPVFYTQTRVGLDRRANRYDRYDTRREEDLGGRVFTIYKFRTMRLDAEAHGQAVWATKDDPRITTIGNVLRKFRLDELPQLWNVLRGDMNVVGPRPERPSIFLTLRTQVPNYHLRQRVRPGITGWAQINQAYDTDIEDVKRKVQLDLEYIQQRSIGHDVKIMVMTPSVMLGRKGAH
jgi:lipopolysaccharide/colanic/teichoic acid biosynthesis glycosyltransferase